MITHVVWCWGFGSLSILAFYCKPLNYAMTLMCVVMAAYYGSTYIFQYLVRYYERGIVSAKIVERPERIIAADFGELVESIGSGKSILSDSLKLEEDPDKPISLATRFGNHMVKK